MGHLGDAERCGLRAGVRLHDDFHVLSQRDKETQQPLHGELPEVAMQQLRNIGLLHAEEPGRLDLLEAALRQQRVDNGHQLRLEEMILGRRRYFPNLKNGLNHAMKARDPARAFGAVLGKALRPLQAGTGLIPILVALQ